MPDPSTPSRRSVVRGVAWSVPVVSVAATAPAFAASANVALLQTGCDTFYDGSGGCGSLIRQARVSWRIDVTLPIPAGTNLQVMWSRPLYCRHNRVTGSLRNNAFISDRSATETATTATYPVLKPIPNGTYTFEDGFAVESGAPTLITLTVPPVRGEGITSDNSAGRNVRAVMGLTTCSL